MYASIAGLRAHMQKLTVIGNNVANVNTQGYKKQRTVFRDGIYSMYSGGTNGTETIGSKNPSQLGYGSMVGSIDLNMSSSSYNPGNPTDCALVGDGFFLIGDKDVQYSIDPMNPDSFKAMTLTRVGDFHFGADNYLVDGNKNTVYGFMVTGVDEQGEPIVSDQLVPLRLPRWEKVPTEVEVEGEDGTTTTEKSYKYEIRYATDVVTKADGTTAAVIGPLVDSDKPQDKSNQVNSKGEASTNPDDWADLEFAKFSSISIDAGTGAITGVCSEGDQVVTIGYLAIGSVTNPNGVSHIGNSYYKCMEGAGDLRISMLGSVNKDLGINNVNSYMAKNVDENGQPVEGATPLPAGSQVTGTATEMMTGFLEAPNTDLAEEISELITTQRGYQANTRIITVTDSMLEELVNMKR